MGPGKCGSSSIQYFFKNQKNPCYEKLEFIQLEPQVINKLNHINVIKNDINYFNKFIEKALKSKDTLIISHEYLFDCPNAIKNICNISRNKVSEILIIGYSRRQSDFLVSTYSQWFFRSSARIEEVEGTLIKNELEPIHFNGIERHIIASIIDDFYSARQLSDMSILNWYKSYQAIERLTSSLKVKIRPGVIPNKQYSINLIEDFCTKADLSIKTNVKKATNVKSNVNFNRELIEALNNATQQGLNTPTPHQDNNYLARISDKMNILSEPSCNFLTILKQYIDSYFLNANIEFCKKFGIDINYFEVQKHYSKTDIMVIIKNEEKKRISNNYATKYYRLLSALMAETCLSLIKER